MLDLEHGRRIYPWGRHAGEYRALAAITFIATAVNDVPEPAGRGLDMLRCPVAEYLAAHGASDLAVASWCNLDFPLARMWGGELERHGTLAGGAEHCDFRFRARSDS